MEDKVLMPINEKNFDDIVYESEEPVLVMYGAKRCTVCKELLPTVEVIAEEYSEKMKFFWLDVDENKSIVKSTKIKGIPTLALFNEGALEGKMGGLKSKEEVVSFINKLT